MLDNFSNIIETLGSFGVLIGMIIFLYRLLTTKKQRIKYNKYIRYSLFRTYKISWLVYSKFASLKVLFLLNIVYGIPKDTERLLSKSYFNERTWKASFTISLFYIFLLGFIGFYWFLEPEYNFLSMSELNIMYTVIISFLLFWIIYYIMRKKIIFNLPKYKQIIYTIIILFLIEFFDDIYLNIALVVIIIPSFLVWMFGVNGFVSYIQAICGYMIITIYMLIGKIDEIEYYFIYIILFLSFLIYISKLRTLEYSFNRTINFIFLMHIFLIPIYIFTFLDINEMRIIFYSFFVVLLFIGTVVLNSLSDLISGNISRWLFYKIQDYSKWKELFNTIIFDIVIGLILVVITSSLLFMLFSSLTLLSDPNFIFNIRDIDSQLMSTLKFNEILNVFTASFNIFTQENNKTTTYLLWYCYISILIPTFLHFLFINILVITKLTSLIIQIPSKHIHKLLLERIILGKYDLNISRSDIVVSLFILVICFIIILMSNIISMMMK